MQVRIWAAACPDPVRLGTTSYLSKSCTRPLPPHNLVRIHRCLYPYALERGLPPAIATLAPSLGSFASSFTVKQSIRPRVGVPTVLAKVLAKMIISFVDYMPEILRDLLGSRAML